MGLRPAPRSLPDEAKPSPVLIVSVVFHIRILPARTWEGSW